MKFDPTVAGLLLSLVCAVSGWVVWWFNKIQFDKQLSNQRAADAAKKEYAAQRDFEHLKNNQIQISEAIAHGFEDLEDMIRVLGRDLTEMKAYLIRTRINDRGGHTDG
ncbi:hypothetical protein NIES25_51620 [Nostoc linckia NIES-25]|nr:hypothetical protein NIES25_05940 [Nostoc linckia NIES-25]BAY78659.1 hypothetical protein NIES25_51350 [Nostoc linckia NIES-25]BAY78686.1 hypothetical protein NIES25_51620 [Nostoc linckia NIES-25]